MNCRRDRSRRLRQGLLCAALVVGGCGSHEDPLDLSVAVDTTVPHQTLVGFGAAVAYQPFLLAGQNDDIYQVLFVDSGLDILRIANWYQNQDRTNATLTTPFSDRAQVQIVQKATAARGGTPPKILMSSWTPPAYLKSNGMTRPAYGSASTASAVGTLLQNGGAYAYSDFADWWVRSLQAYAAQGVTPDYISIQNEPDYFNSGWETCVFGATEGARTEGIPAAGYGQALDAVHGAVQASDLAAPPTILGPETTGFGDGIVQRYLAGMNLAQVGGIAHHMYGATADNPNPDSFSGAMRAVASSVASTALPGFMTEYSPNAPTMFETAWLMSNALTVENASAYIYWELTWNDATPQTGLVSISSPSPGSPYTINDTYYALEHFARWTDPGWVRVDATSTGSSLRASAFVSPDGASLTLVLLNTDARDHFVTVSPGAFAFGTLTVHRTSGDSERAAVVALESDGSLSLPSRSIATLTYTP
ncbi:MAG TPA: glycoside hydrolase family 30 beta sandwich domain-containing protein [Polyangia bacterium]|jgi:glucuronoarabinoxylan endo-1,4-beta-xylanase